MPDEQLSGLARDGESIAEAIERVGPTDGARQPGRELPAVAPRAAVAGGRRRARPASRRPAARRPRGQRRRPQGPRAHLRPHRPRRSTTFTDRDDVDGQAVAWWVRGNVQLGAGRPGRGVAGLAPGRRARPRRRAGRGPGPGQPGLRLVLRDRRRRGVARAGPRLRGVVARPAPTGGPPGLALVYAAYFQILAGRFDQAEQELSRGRGRVRRRSRPRPTSGRWPTPAQGALAGHPGPRPRRPTPPSSGASAWPARSTTAGTRPSCAPCGPTTPCSSTPGGPTSTARWALRVFEEIGDTWFAARPPGGCGPRPPSSPARSRPPGCSPRAWSTS